MKKLLISLFIFASAFSMSDDSSSANSSPDCELGDLNLLYLLTIASIIKDTSTRDSLKQHIPDSEEIEELGSKGSPVGDRDSVKSEDGVNSGTGNKHINLQDSSKRRPVRFGGASLCDSVEALNSVSDAFDEGAQIESLVSSLAERRGRNPGYLYHMPKIKRWKD